MEDVPLTPEYKGNTIIGNDVWIGYNTMIMTAIKIGDGALPRAQLSLKMLKAITLW